MKRTKNMLCVIVIIFVLASVMFIILSVNASGGGNSSTRQSTVNGYTYNYYALIYAGYTNGVAYANSSVSIRTSPSGTIVPPGWMHAQAKLYKHSGALVATAISNTNSSSSSYLKGNYATLKPAVSNTLYYGGGTVGFWNGATYSYYSTYNTPSFQP